MIRKTIERIVCPKCQGLGEITHGTRISWDDYEYHTEICSVCKGLRVVIQETRLYADIEEEKEIDV